MLFRSALVVLLLVLAVPSFAATIDIMPATATLRTGDTTTFSIMLDTQGAAIDGVDIHYLHFDPAILELVDAVPTQAGVQIGPGDLMPVTVSNDVLRGDSIQFSQVSSGGTTYTGSGVLASLTFRALQPGTTSLTFDAAPANTADTNVASGGQDILTRAGGLTVTVNGITQAQAPTTPTTPSSPTSTPNVPATTDTMSMLTLVSGLVILFLLFVVGVTIRRRRKGDDLSQVPTQ